jgi:hypothetical protein
MIYGLDVKPIIESKARLLRFFKTKDFFAGQKLEVSFQSKTQVAKRFLPRYLKSELTGLRGNTWM